MQRPVEIVIAISFIINAAAIYNRYFLIFVISGRAVENLAFTVFSTLLHGMNLEW